MRLSARIHLFVVAGLFSVCSFSNQLFAWGAVGHEIVNEAAINLMPASPLKTFFERNKDNLKRMANIPDSEWKSGWLAVHEAPTHFFKWDQYHRSPLRSSMPLPLANAVKLVGRQYVVDNGSAVWRSHQIFDLLQKALDKKDWPNVLKMAGVLGHYIGDLSQPMHVSSDYDGQSINKPGIHSRFESKLISSLNREELLLQVEKRGQEKMAWVTEQTSLGTVHVSFEQGKRALAKLPEILKEYKRDTARDEVLAPQAVDYLAEGATTLAALWSNAAQEESSTEFPDKKLIIHAPKWVSFKMSETPSSLMPVDICNHE